MCRRDVSFLVETFDFSEHAPQGFLILGTRGEDIGLPMVWVASQKLDVNFIVLIS